MKGVDKLRIAVTAGALVLIFGTILFGDLDRFPQALKNDVHFRSGPFFGWLLLISVYFWLTTAAALKAMTNRLVGHNQIFPINPNDGTFNAGPWQLERIGGFNAPKVGMSWPGTDGTVIYPADAVVPFGPTRVVLADFKKTPYRQLPEEARDKIEEESMPGPYYIAYAAAYVETLGKDWTADVRKFRVENATQYNSEVGLKRTVQSLQYGNRAQAKQLARMTQPKATGWLRQLWKSDDAKDNQFDDERDRV